jgi:hypothetical protein
MKQPQAVPPGPDELQAYCVGLCSRERAAEIEAYLSGGPDCTEILQAAPTLSANTVETAVPAVSATKIAAAIAAEGGPAHRHAGRKVDR